jgi:hypothetical protein
VGAEEAGPRRQRGRCAPGAGSRRHLRAPPTPCPPAPCRALAERRPAASRRCASSSAARCAAVWAERTRRRAASAMACLRSSLVSTNARSTSSASCARWISRPGSNIAASPSQRSEITGVPQAPRLEQPHARRPSRADHVRARHVQREAGGRVELRVVLRRDVLEPLDIRGPRDVLGVLRPRDAEPHPRRAPRDLDQQPLHRRLPVRANRCRGRTGPQRCGTSIGRYASGSTEQ